jgi:hypothetical protein
MLKLLFGNASSREMRIVWIRFLILLTSIISVGVCVLFDQARLGSFAFITAFLAYIGMTIWQWIIRTEDFSNAKKNEQSLKKE